MYNIFIECHLEVDDSDGTVNSHVHAYPVVQPQRYGTMRGGDGAADTDVGIMLSPVLRVDGGFFGVIRPADRLPSLPPDRRRSRIRGRSTQAAPLFGRGLEVLGQLAVSLQGRSAEA